MSNLPVRNGGRGKCSLCVSPLRPEIERLLKKGVPIIDISRSYHEVFNNTEASLYLKIKRHITRKHPVRIIDTEAAKEKLRERAAQVASGATIENYADQMLKIGLSDELLNPGRVSHANVISAQKLKLDKDKLKLQSDATRMAMINRGGGSR